MGVLLRPDPLYFAGDRDLRRRRHVHAGVHARECAAPGCAGRLPGSSDSCLPLVVGPVDASPARRLFRHLHVRTDRTHAPADQLVRDQHHQQAEPLHPDVSVDAITIYEMLLALAVMAVVGSWYVSSTRLGYALRAIGEDETVARHTGINTTRVKVLVFAIAAAMMALVGGVYALALPEHRPDGRLQQRLVVPGADRRAARRAGKAVGSGGRRGAAGSLVRLSRRQLFAIFHHRARHLLRRDRLFHPGRRRSAARAASYRSLARASSPIWPQSGDARASTAPSREADATSPELVRIRARTPIRHDAAPALISCMACKKRLAASSRCATFPSTSRRRHHRPDRAERLRQDHRAEPHHRRISGRCRLDPLPGRGALRRSGSFDVCRAQVARTFQLVRILPGMTTRENSCSGGCSAATRRHRRWR